MGGYKQLGYQLVSCTPPEGPVIKGKNNNYIAF